MPTLFLMVGLPAAGKTTFARQIEREQAALRLTPDEWLARLGADAFDEGFRAKVEALCWQVAARALELGSNVVLDFGFWSRRERDDFKARAAALGATAEIRFVDATKAELLARLRERATNSRPGEYAASEAQLDQYIGWFEPPTPEELA
jgi:predicted kinase